MLETAREALARGAVAALDPNLRAEAEGRMSRTYTEGLDARARELDEGRRTLAQQAASAARWAGQTCAKAIVDGPLEAVAAGYSGQVRGAPSAAFYADLLEVYSARGHKVARFVELAKEEALGVLPDSAATIELAAGERASVYHPLQAMGLTFTGVPGGAPRDTQEAAMVVDMTLPQARESVVYDLGALIDEKRAGRGSAMLGLNFKLVARLDTIRATPIVPSKQPTPAQRFSICRAECGHGVARTVDGGQSYEWVDYSSPLLPTRGDTEFVSALPAGPRERVAAFNLLVQQAVLEDRPGVLVEDRDRLLERFEEGKDERGLEVSSSAARSAVEASGVVAARLDHLEERKKLERAAGKLLDAALDRSLLRPELVGAGRRPELSGALEAARSETALTMLLRAESLAEELEKRVKQASTLREAFPDTEPPEIAPSLKLYALAYK
jgi:hypothetical protein